VEQLQAQIAEQQKQLEAKDQKIKIKDEALAFAELKIQALEERLRLERIKKYGPRSETLSDLQLKLLDLEPGVSSEEVAAESQRGPLEGGGEEDSEKATDKPEKKKEKKPKRPGRNELPAHLERVKKIIPCPPAQCVCGQCGNETKVIGYETSEVLDVKPAEYFVSVYMREKRACPKHEEMGVQTAAVPDRIAPKSILSDNVIIDILVNKYSSHLPLYRQQWIFKRDNGIRVALSTIDDAVLHVGGLLIPISAATRLEVLAEGYIQGDETTVPVRVPDMSGKNHQGYLWQYGSPGKSVVFDFQMGRGGKYPKAFLGGFNGLLQTDGYEAYNDVGGPDLVHAGCWSHARRGFVDAIKVNKQDVDSAEIVSLIDEMFAVDREAREKGLDIAQRHELRKQRSFPLLDQIHAKVNALKGKVLPKSLAGKAAGYVLSQWSKLIEFKNHPELELSTNLAENTFRQPVIGRKNWMHFGSEQAGPKIAAIITVVESCRRLNIDVRKYLADVLPGLADRSIRDIAQLTPAAWAARQANQPAGSAPTESSSK